MHEIGEKMNQYYVRHDSYEAWVQVAVSAAGHKYLRTDRDKSPLDNLLFLENRA